MNDFVKSGLGTVESDAEIKSIVQKPIWHLVPLPISQIKSSANKPLYFRGQIPTLRSSCLSVISKNLHKYTIDSFKNIPSIFIERIISRIRNDRQYEDEFTAFNGYSTHNPDECTIWILSALLNPQGTLEKNDGSFQLSLPQDSILNHLTPNKLLKYPDHPLVELPKLYKTLHQHSNISLLTSLTLDGMNEFVNDHNIQSLKYCTNLTVLWMKGCRITDIGIRLLTSSLELPKSIEGKFDGRGMCKLRSWSVGGCRGVSDKAMTSFARYPGLVMLDIRDTSCTTSAIDIFNRTSRNLFSAQNPDFQPCTDGLLDLFSRNTTSADIVDKLCLTLIKLPNTIVMEKSHLSLNIVPSHRPLDERYLPESSQSYSSENAPFRKTWESSDSKSVYRLNGIGQIYGTSVSKVSDEVKDFRERRKLAIELSEKSNQAIQEAKAYEEMGTNGRRAFTRKKNKAIKEEREFNWKFKYGKFNEEDLTGAYKKATTKTYKQRGKKGETERSKSFVMGKKGEQLLIDRIAKDDSNLMLVRMVNDDWEHLKWTVNTGSTGFTQTTSKSNKTSTIGFSLSQNKMKASNLVEDLLNTTMSITSSTEPSFASSQNSNPFKLSQCQSTQTSISSSPFTNSQEIQRTGNPFKSQKSKANSMGVRPLSSTPFRPLSTSQTQSNSTTPPFSQSSISSSPFSQSIDRKPFARTVNHIPISTGPTIKKRADDLNFFSTGSKKRSFDGVGESENKRVGMKMFSLGSQKR
ncbi:uncharacterized protein I206_107011 [Kwoniella pini CBS 10737]|uniref:Uncharacterized protein n=1 Tax=Kwoniella pini CBS 10737 TaxID=1296096 RepID=A0A1B9HZG3_9TREE|nr:uncharacterized protein I206_05446 [Kwoniella pini CBS 10737]OCF48666.1 hypothetical protein I206_05446 [Kwoniella pini CBS 10737]